MDLQTLVKYISQGVSNPPPDKPDDLSEMFRLYDTSNSGYITVGEMTHLLTNIGEKLTEDDVQDLFRMTGAVEGGRVNYRSRCFCWFDVY